MNKSGALEPDQRSSKPTLAEWFRVLLVVVIAGMLAWGCLRWYRPVAAELGPTDANVYEVVLRAYLTGEDGLDKPAVPQFVSIDDMDPPAWFMQRFQWQKPAIYPGSTVFMAREPEVLLGRIRWVGRQQAQVNVVTRVTLRQGWTHYFFPKRAWQEHVYTVIRDRAGWKFLHVDQGKRSHNSV